MLQIDSKNRITLTRGDTAVLKMAPPYLTSPQAETGGKVVASIYQPESEMWIDVDMEDITIGAESDAFIEFK